MRRFLKVQQVTIVLSASTAMLDIHFFQFEVFHNLFLSSRMYFLITATFSRLYFYWLYLITRRLQYETEKLNHIILSHLKC